MAEEKNPTAEELVKEAPIEVKEYKLVEVPTGSQVAFQKPDGTLITNEQALVEVLNKCDEIIKAIG